MNTHLGCLRTGCLGEYWDVRRKKWHYEELYNFSSPNIIRKVKRKKYEMGGACSSHG
jgi:hypothetical protein